jgi:putative sigma-54 modulation protein
MRINIIGRRIEVTEAIHDYVDKKIFRLSKYYNRISEIEVVLEEEGLNKKVEILIKAEHSQRFVVSESGEDLYACVDIGVDKIERQLTRLKEKARNRKGRTGTSQATSDVLESQEQNQSQE